MIETSAIEAGAVPIDTTGAVVAGDWVSMKNYQNLLIIIKQGAWAAGTPAVTLDQATVVAGTDTKTLGFTTMWTKTGLTGTTFTKTAVTSDTFNLTATANTITAIEVDASQLDADNDFDCFQVDIASPGSNADLICVSYLLYEPRYPQALPPDPKVD